MPPLAFKSVKSFSSEDPLFPASNLLSSTTSTGKKWKCQSVDEKTAEVVLELNHSSTITAIDIGNEHSAFVEVFVSKNGASEFQQILLMSSFMTPLESRNSDPVNRVRCFSKSALVEEVVDSNRKWDLVKVVCSQPFNKRVQYGLSFIKLHSSESKETVNTSEMALAPHKLFGNFKIREDSPDSDSESSQSLFARWKGARNSGDGKGMSPAGAPLSAAAAIRNASTTASLNNRLPQVNRAAVTPKQTENRPSVSDKGVEEDTAITKKNRNRSELMYEDEDEKPNEKLDKVILKERERLEREKNEKKKSDEKKRNSTKTSTVSNDRTSGSSHTTSKTTSKKDTPSKPSKESDRAATTETTTKRQSSPVAAATPPPVKKVKPTRERKYRPFRKLLDGVVLVISGIQNPARANIRQQALDMGAKYKPDWEASCTHLICAFKNTPKYNQVHGHGKIITKDWVTECHKRKMRIPWRRFALDDNDGDAPESEEEIFDESLKPSEPSDQHSNDTKPTGSHASKTSESPSRSAIVLSDEDSVSDNEALDRYNLNSSQVERNSFVSSGSDTEDEIRRVLEKKKTSTTDRDTKSTSSDDIYNATTEEDENSNATSRKPSSSSVAPLPEWFKGKRFYLSRNISSTDEIKLKRFIGVYGGEITIVASDSDYILSNVPKATPAEYKGEVVKPLWIFESNESETLLSTRRYNFSNW